jgi:hypothetical protein
MPVGSMSRLWNNLSQLALAPWRERGARETLRSIRNCFAARRREHEEGFDRQFGTDTGKSFSAADLRAESDDLQQVWRYWPTLPGVFERIMTSARVRHEELTFVDLGSGKGRVLMLACRRPFRRVIGVELSPALHEVARRNLAVFASPERRCFDVELVQSDAALWIPPAEKLFLYLFQPFPIATFTAVLANLRRSLATAPREVVLAYLNPLFADEIAACDFLVLEARHRARARTEFDFAIYRSRT